MAVKVYGPSWSTATTTVILCLEEMGAHYELFPVDLSKGEHKTPSYLAKNPFGLVPVLEDGDLMLYESRAIARYVLRKFHKSSAEGSGGGDVDFLREKSLKESATVDLWVEVESHQFSPAVFAIIREYLVGPVIFGRVPYEKAVEESEKKLGKVLDVYEERLGKSKYLAGDFLSLADLGHVAYLHYLTLTPCAAEVESRPHVKAWWEGLKERPAAKKAIAGMMALAPKP